MLALLDEARLALGEGDLGKAGQIYEQARQVEPENPELWVDIARLRFRRGEHLTAFDAVDRALDLDPNSASALLLRAQFTRDSHGAAESLSWFEAALLVDPSNPGAWADYAASLGDLGRYHDMLTALRRPDNDAANNPQMLYLQAVMAARAGDGLLAGSLLDRSGQVRRGVPGAIMLGAIIDLQQGNADSAADGLELLLGRQPDNVRAGDLLAYALWMGGRDREIVARFEPRANDQGASPYLIMLVGRSLERMGERQRGIVYIKRALERQTEDFTLFANVTPTGVRAPTATLELRAAASTGDRQRLTSLASSFVRQDRYSGGVHGLAGDAALLDGELAGSLEHYEVAARVRRSWPLARKMIYAFDAARYPDAADALLARALAGDPHNAAALLLLAQRSAQRSDWLRVALLLDTAIGLGAGHDLEVLELRVQAARELGQEAQANRYEAALSEARPGDFVAS